MLGGYVKEAPGEHFTDRVNLGRLRDDDHVNFCGVRILAQASLDPINVPFRFEQILFGEAVALLLSLCLESNVNVIGKRPYDVRCTRFCDSSYLSTVALAEKIKALMKMCVVVFLKEAKDILQVLLKGWTCPSPIDKNIPEA